MALDQSSMPVEPASQYEALFDNLGAAIFVADMSKQQLVEISATLEKILGVSKDVLIASPLDAIKLIHPDDRERFKHMALEHFHTAKPYRGQFRLLRPDGQERWVEARACIAPPGGPDPMLYGILFDITALKETENALLQVETHYRLLFDLSLDGLAMFDGQRKLVLANPKAAELYGYASPEEMMGLPLMEFIAHEEWPAVQAKFASSAGTASLNLVGRMRCQDGSTFVAEIGWRSAPDLEGSPNGYLIVSTRDLSEWQRGEAYNRVRLTTTNIISRATDLANAAPLILQAIAENLHWDLGELWLCVPGQPLLERSACWYADAPEMDAFAAFSRDVRLEVSNSLPGLALQSRAPVWEENFDEQSSFVRRSAVRQAGIISALAVPVVTDDASQGALVFMSRKKYAQHSDQLELLIEVGELLGQFIARKQAVAELADERNQLSARLKRHTADLHYANAELSRLVRMKDEFLSNMSHELRTPLNAILGLAESLEEGVYGMLSAPQLETTQIISESGRHLLTLINDILDLSKIEAGKLELNRDVVVVADVCQNSLRLVREQAQHKQLRISFTQDTQVDHLLVDDRRMKQILVNLLSNAVKFTPAGGQVGLEVHAEPETRYVRFCVWDTGIGIPPESIASLFEPFFQLDNVVTRQYSGTGLGLVLVQQLAEMHGGSASVESELGSGSRFCVRLPWLTELPDQVAPQPVAPPQPVQLLPRTGPLRRQGLVLVVDDNQVNQTSVGGYLQFQGYQIAFAPNGQEAIAQCLALTPDLILMDIRMPVMDGLEAMRQIRQLPGFTHTPIIALTALAMPEDRQQCLQAGATEYMSKPVDLKALHQMIQRLLAERQAPKEN